jgi:hypothetical protein
MQTRNFMLRRHAYGVENFSAFSLNSLTEPRGIS